MPTMPIEEQYRVTREQLGHKWSTERCIPYFQAHTNTYADPEILQPLYERALALPGAVGLNIATRADCLPDGVVDLLDGISRRTVLTVELGLQTAHNDTAALINRGHTWEEFCAGYTRLRRGAPLAQVCVHLIFGLPGESEERMLETVRATAALRPHQVKLHLLHVLRNTVLGTMYERGEYCPMTREDYVRTVVRALELLPPDTVIGRLTGDGMGADLLAPDWSRRKVSVINDIDKLMFAESTWQGRLFA
jgi:radical SAM protein (TIGR01212 family)